MTNRVTKLLTIFIMLTLISCSYFDNKSNDIKKALIGSWVLDSISTPSGKYFDNSDCQNLTFINNTDYAYEWHNGDVLNTFTGKYFILDNPKRGLKTIALIPDIQHDGKDTIRIEYMNFDIVDISTDRLQVVDETKFIKRDSSPSVIFNKNYIYKRTK